MTTHDGGLRLAGRVVRLGVLWVCGLAAMLYVPALWMVGALGRCVAEDEDSILCTDVGAWTVVLFPVVALPAALTVGSRAALRRDGRGWAAWAVCLAVVVAVAALYAYFGLAW
jgi:hypothetical protein